MNVGQWVCDDIVGNFVKEMLNAKFRVSRNLVLILILYSMLKHATD